MIPYGRHEINKDDVNKVIEVLNSDFLTQGPAVPLFESELSSFCGVNNAVAVNSCTSALHVACLSLGLGKGDTLWTSPITFVSSANCALYCGALVDFIDVEPDTALISIEALKKKLEKAKIDGNLPKIIIPVHFAGQSCDMEEIFILSKKYGFKIIEDAAHAIGGYYKDYPIGSCRFSDITVFSFHPVKIITTGEGGAALTNNNDYAKKMKLLRSHGITRNPSEMEGNGNNLWYYEQIDLGFNYRMNDIQATLGRSQLLRVRSYVEKRSEIANWYDKYFSKISWIKPLIQKSERLSSYHLYVIKISLGLKARNEIVNYLRKIGIGVNVHYIPVYKQPYHRRKTFLHGAEDYYQNSISLPIYPTITHNDMKKVVQGVLNSYKES